MVDTQYQTVVKTLQSFLNAKVPIEPLLKVDGDLGLKTYKRAQTYQMKVLGAQVAEREPSKPAPKLIPWRLAFALDKLRNQVNTRYPNRSKASDGTIGDERHQSRSSDHNPHVRDGNQPIVTALDLTHDMANGFNAGALAEAIKDDPRVEYVIWNKRIYNRSMGLKWRPYSGANPHTAHVHVSVHEDKRRFDDTSAWDIDNELA